MATKYLELMFTEAVRRAQTRYYGNAGHIAGAPERDLLSQAEIEFIAARDSFYLGTVNAQGWPYIQHRGGPRGFLKILDASTLAFADYKGNRQLLSTGNLAENDRVSLFLMDYQHRERLKILGHARVQDARRQPELAAQVADPQMRGSVERLVLIDVVSFDWNCPKYITPRYAIEDVEASAEPLKARIAELEAELHAVQTQRHSAKRVGAGN